VSAGELSNDGGSVSTDLDMTSGVGTVEFCRPPHNYFDADLIARIADAYDELGHEVRCRAIVLASTGRHFCAGADFSDSSWGGGDLQRLYEQAARLFDAKVPVVAAVQGRAIGGGLGLALSADFRVASERTVFVCNFARLGLHHGFGISVTLPAVVGQQRALEMLYTGGESGGNAAIAMGLCDHLAPSDEHIRSTALEAARAIAQSAPLAVRSIRQTMRGHLAEVVRASAAAEALEQEWLFKTEDFFEGVRAARERRDPRFTGL
jgi:2-(1,2-epoxy-1,2-dihydrophenyl)acetyl-CoA isomerase